MGPGRVKIRDAARSRRETDRFRHNVLPCKSVSATSCYTLTVNQQRARRDVIAAVLFVVVWTCPRLCARAAKDPADSAKAIAQLLEDHYRHVQTLRAVFLEHYSTGPREARVESGTVYFRRPGRMRWEYEAPEKKLFLADGKSVWFYVPADRTATKAALKESSDWRTPLALLTGKANLARLCSHIDLMAQKNTPSGHSVLRCVPKGEKDVKSALGASSEQDPTELPGAGDFTEVLLEVNSSSGELDSVRIRQAGGIEIEYRFGDWQEGLPLPEEMFQFHPPPGVAIVDGSALNKASQESPSK
jgi:outer membrane lipoprotein carrier protein